MRDDGKIPSFVMLKNHEKGRVATASSQDHSQPRRALTSNGFTHNHDVEDNLVANIQKKALAQQKVKKVHKNIMKRRASNEDEKIIGKTKIKIKGDSPMKDSYSNVHKINPRGVVSTTMLQPCKDYKEQRS